MIQNRLSTDLSVDRGPAKTPIYGHIQRILLDGSGAPAVAGRNAAHWARQLRAVDPIGKLEDGVREETNLPKRKY